ncbi:MAG: NAD(P)-binding protein [Bacteroidetes bacterium]|nr:NAD(P)-binding protein [Bacteroidota bacterium]
MEAKYDYDVVVAGAGPAGLSVAAELSKDFKVLVFDRRLSAIPGATWYSYEDRMITYGLEEAIANRCSSLIYESPNHRHEMKDDCIVVDEKAVFEIWQKRILDNKGEIKRMKLVSCSSDKDGVVVHADKQHIRARLLIDCTGIGSPILRKHRLVKHINSWVCYGYSLLAENVNADQIHFAPLNDEINTYVGIHPTSATEVNFYVFVNVENEVGDSSKLKQSFEMAREKYFPNAKKQRLIEGKIISGELKRYALDHVVFFGEAGMLTPPGIGMGFNEILVQHRPFTEGIAHLMRTNRLRASHLQKLSLSLRDKETINFQRIIGKFSYYFNFEPSKYDGGVQWLNKMGHDSKYWMRNEINMAWIKSGVINLNNIFTLKEVLRVMPAKDFLFIAKHFLRFLNNALSVEIRNYRGK